MRRVFFFPVWSELTDQLIHAWRLKTDPDAYRKHVQLLGTLPFRCWNSGVFFPPHPPSSNMTSGRGGVTRLWPEG